MTGRTLNHYKVGASIGRGGMGEVYAAEDLKLSRQVAIKILPERLAGNPERRMRFEREAKAIAALNHPNIVTIYSVEEAEGVHFLTMEMVQGKPLSELIPKGGLSLEKILGLAVALADAAGAAHRKGVIHRDLKPGNIVVGEDGRLKVLDFGLAKLDPDVDDPAPASQLPTEVETQEGRVLGTVAYMSPEQAEGKPVDARSDIFSIGVLLYEMASGQRPFSGDTPISTISSILRDTPDSILDLNRSLPRHLGRIVKRCLAKDPERRYQTAIDLRNDLEGLREEVQSGEVFGEVHAAAGRTARSGWIIGGGGAVLAALVLGYVAWSRMDRPVQVAPSAFEGMKMTRLTATGDASEAAISRDGKYVVYRQGGEEGNSLWLRQVSLSSSVQIVPPDDINIFDPVFSPEGDAIYYIKSERESWNPVLYRVPVLGGTPIRVLEDVWERVSFSPDGSRFVFPRRRGSKALVLTAASDGGDVRTIAERADPDDFAEEPVWSPDGTIVAVPAVRWTGRLEFSLVAIPAEGGAERSLSRRTWADMGEIAWIPDGSGLVIIARESMSGPSQLWEVSYPEGSARRITNDLNSYHGVSLTSDGAMMVTVLNEAGADLWAAPGDHPDGEMTKLPGKPDWGGLLISWTRDGRVVYASGVSGNTDIWTTGEAGGASQLTFDPGEDYDPVVCGGRYIVFASSRAGSHNLWRMDLDGGNKVRLTSGESEWLPRCHPDGTRVIFQRQGPGLAQIAEVPIEGGEALTLKDLQSQAWWTMDASPDGSKVAYLVFHQETRRWVLEILDLASREVAQRPDISFEIGSAVRWSPDGRSLEYVEGEEGVDNLWTVPLEGGSPLQLTSFDSGEIRSFVRSHDGTKLALTRGTVSSDIVLLKSFR